MKTKHNHADFEVIRQLREGNESAMIILYEQYWKRLYISAYKILGDKEACEDIVQDIFIKIWDNRQIINITSSFESYLKASVRYEVYRKIRQFKRYEPIIDEMTGSLEAASGQDILEYKELELQIESVIKGLPEKCKEVYQLSRYEMLSHKEIAQKLSISPKTVRNHLTRALHQLRVSMHQMIVFIAAILYLR